MYSFSRAALLSSGNAPSQPLPQSSRNPRSRRFASLLLGAGLSPPRCPPDFGLSARADSKAYCAAPNRSAPAPSRREAVTCNSPSRPRYARRAPSPQSALRITSRLLADHFLLSHEVHDLPNRTASPGSPAPPGRPAHCLTGVLLSAPAANVGERSTDEAPLPRKLHDCQKCAAHKQPWKSYCPGLRCARRR